MEHEAYLLKVKLWNIPLSSRHLLRFTLAAESLMQDIREAIGMKQLEHCPPSFVYADAEDKAWGRGVTGIIPLQDSHMAYHALEDHKVAYLQIFSCSDINPELVCFMLQQVVTSNGRAVLIDEYSGLEIYKKEW